GHVFLQSLLNLSNLELRRDLLLHGANTLLDIELLEDCLLLRNIDVQVRRQKISELLGVLDIEDHQTRLLRRVRRQLKQSRSRIAQVPESRFPFLGFWRLAGLRQIDLSAEKRRSRDDFAKGKPTQTLRDDQHVVIRLAYQLEHQRGRADRVEVLWRWLLLRLIALRQQPDHLRSRQRVIEQFERGPALDIEWNNRARKNDEPAHWQNG